MPSAKSGNDAAPTSAQPEPTFEEALARLDAIVRELEEGRIGLADALARYEQGAALLKQCHTLLETAEQRIELLTGVGPDGRAITKEFEHVDAASSGAPGRSRGKRRPAEAPVPATPNSESDSDPCDELPPQSAPTAEKKNTTPAPPAPPQLF